MSAKTKIFFATAVALWDAEFYVKVDDDVHVNIGKEAIIVQENRFLCFLLPLGEQSLNGEEFYELHIPFIMLANVALQGHGFHEVKHN